MSVQGDVLKQKEKRTKMLPYFLVRMAGLPIGSIMKMRASRTMQQLYRMTVEQEQLSQLTGSITDRIEREIPQIECNKTRGGLIRYKRDIYNGRFPKQRAGLFSKYLPSSLLKSMNQWEQKYENVQRFEEMAREHFREELIASRKIMQNLIVHPNLLNGIALTSQDLFHKAVKYAETPVENQKARLRKVEYSLSKILSRVAAKTSPFSTFTPVGIGRWEYKTGSGDFPFSVIPYRSYIRINHANVLRIVSGLLKRPEVKRLLHYRINATLIADDKKVKMIRRVDDSQLRARVFQTIESPMSLNNNQAITMILELIRSNPEKELLYYQLLENLKEKTNFSTEQIQSFLDQLIDLQLLVPCVPLYEQSPDILTEVINWLDSWSEKVVVQVRDELKHIREDIQRYEWATPGERVQLLKKIRDKFTALCQLLDTEISSDSLGLLLFEDAIIDGQDRVEITKWEKNLRDLEMYQKLAPILDSKYRMQSTIAHKFIELYGKDGVCNKPGQFLSQVVSSITDYYESMLPMAMLKDLEIHNEVETVRRLNELKKEFGKLLKSKFAASKEEVEITSEEIRSLEARLPEPIRRRTVSNDFFVQIARQGDRDRFVLNHGYIGFSAFYSRFLQYCPETIIQEVRDYLQSLVRDRTLAEVSGVFGFNANLHPPLAPYELVLPMMPPTRVESIEKEISWEELSMVYDETKDQVVLHHPTKGEVSVFFAGTLVPLLLPFVVNFLSTNFGNGNMPENLHLFAEKNLMDDEKKRIRQYPRICVGEVIIARKKWIVPRNCLPERERNDTDFDYFCKVHRWRIKEGLPSQVFIRFTPLDESESPFQNVDGLEKEQARFDFTNWKPQWIDFENPIMVRLLGKMIENSSTGMVVEEMLPNIGEIVPNKNGDKIASELVIELSQVSEEA